MPLLCSQVFQDATIEDRESSSEVMSAILANGAFGGASLGLTQGQPFGKLSFVLGRPLQIPLLLV